MEAGLEHARDHHGVVAAVEDLLHLAEDRAQAPVEIRNAVCRIVDDGKANRRRLVRGTPTYANRANDRVALVARCHVDGEAPLAPDDRLDRIQAVRIDDDTRRVERALPEVATHPQLGFRQLVRRHDGTHRLNLRVPDRARWKPHALQQIHGEQMAAHGVERLHLTGHDVRDEQRVIADVE